jgi:hypothetical protein
MSSAEPVCLKAVSRIRSGVALTHYDACFLRPTRRVLVLRRRERAHRRGRQARLGHDGDAPTRSPHRTAATAAGLEAVPHVHLGRRSQSALTTGIPPAYPPPPPPPPPPPRGNQYPPIHTEARQATWRRPLRVRLARASVRPPCLMRCRWPRVRARVRACVCVCACVRARKRACDCVRVCVCVRAHVSE